MQREYSSQKCGGGRIPYLPPQIAWLGACAVLSAQLRVVGRHRLVTPYTTREQAADADMVYDVIDGRAEPSPQPTKCRAVVNNSAAAMTLRRLARRGDGRQGGNRGKRAACPTMVLRALRSLREIRGVDRGRNAAPTTAARGPLALQCRYSDWRIDAGVFSTPSTRNCRVPVSPMASMVSPTFLLSSD